MFTHDSRQFPHTLAYLEQWGNHASFMIAEQPYLLYIEPCVEGLIAYQQYKSTWLVTGDPVCKTENLIPMLKSFESYARKQGKKTLYLNASQSVANFFESKQSATIITIGNELIINTQRNRLQETGSCASQLRKKWRKSEKNGQRVHEYKELNENIEKRILALSNAWLTKRTGLQAYMYHPNIFENRHGKRWFYVEQQGAIIGILTMNRIGQGWVLNMMMCAPDALNSTSAFLIISVLEILRAEQCALFSVGIHADQQLKFVRGISAIKQWIAQSSYQLCNKIFGLEKRTHYWMQFKPKQKPTYLIAPAGLGITSLWALMKSLHMVGNNNDK